jgi:nucleoside-diphosphate-sugar epimerase
MILVTGASGFVGCNLVPTLAQQNKIRLLVRHTSHIAQYVNKENIEIVYGDLEKNRGIEEALRGVDTVIHGAARTIGKNLKEYYRTNTLATRYVIEAMKRGGAKRILFLSSHAVSGPCESNHPIRETDPCQPISYYGMTKKYAEDIVIKSGLSYIIIRPVAVYGPHDHEILRYIRFVNRGLFPKIGRGEKFTNLIYVADLVDVIMRIITGERFDKRIYFVSDGECYAVSDVVRVMADILKRHTLTICVPESVAQAFSLFNDVLLPQHRRLVWRDKVKELKESRWMCCSDALTTTFDFTPRYTLYQGMKATILWYKEHGYLK